MATAICAQAEEANGTFCQAQGNFLATRQPTVGQVIELINPILRGWVNYYRIGHSGRCFSKIRDCVEKKIRRHLMRARLRKGQGWKRWSSEWIYRVLGLYNDYSLSRSTLT